MTYGGHLTSCPYERMDSCLRRNDISSGRPPLAVGSVIHDTAISARNRGFFPNPHGFQGKPRATPDLSSFPSSEGIKGWVFSGYEHGGGSCPLRQMYVVGRVPSLAQQASNPTRHSLIRSRVGFFAAFGAAEPDLRLDDDVYYWMVLFSFPSQEGPGVVFTRGQKYTPRPSTVAFLVSSCPMLMTPLFLE